MSSLSIWAPIRWPPYYKQRKYQETKQRKYVGELLEGNETGILSYKFFFILI